MALRCSTCGISLIGQENFVKFDCPNCAKVEIIRCARCKLNSNVYRCGTCDFEGP
jgi:hypothetical protein